MLAAARNLSICCFSAGLAFWTCMQRRCVGVSGRLQSLRTPPRLVRLPSSDLHEELMVVVLVAIQLLPAAQAEPDGDRMKVRLHHWLLRRCLRLLPGLSLARVAMGAMACSRNTLWRTALTNYMTKLSTKSWEL